MLRFVAISVLLMPAGLAAPTHAQTGTTQTNVLGVPPTLSSPLLADIVRSYEQGLFPIQVVYSSPSSRAIAFRMRMAFFHNGRRLGEIESQPALLSPGVYTYSTLDTEPAFIFSEGLDDIIDIINAELPGDLQQTGALPEGQYMLTLEVVPDDPATLVVPLPGTAVFNVRFAQPPVLFTPTDRAVVNQSYPIFSWTPVTTSNLASFAYDFLLVERLPGQTPLQAIESNRAYAEQTLFDQSTLVYGPELLPLKRGGSYVWQVTARDALGQIPVTEGGQSEIFSFVYEPVGGEGEPLELLRSIVLEPGFATLTGLGSLSKVADEFSYTVDGTALLELQFAATPVTVPVEVSSLRIQNINLDDPILLSGSVRATERSVDLPLGPAGDALDIQYLGWTFGEGFSVRARLAVAQQLLDVTGELRLTASGVFGELSASGDPLLLLGDDNVGLRIENVTASFPEAVATANGSLSLFGEDTACEIGRLVLSGDEISVPLGCNLDHDLPLVERSSKLMLHLDRVSGSTSFDAGTSDFSYNFALESELRFDVEQGSDCGLGVVLGLDDEGGVQVQRSYPSCATTTPRIGLGLFDLDFSDLSLTELTYGPRTGWDFAAVTDGRLISDRLGRLSHYVNGVGISTTGIRIPDVRVSRDALQALPAVPVDGFELKFSSLSVAAFEFPWFTWDQSDGGPWQIQFDASLRAPDTPEIPGCLADAELGVSGEMGGDQILTGTLRAARMRPCRWSVGPGYAVEIEQIEGTVQSEGWSESGMELTARLRASGNLQMGDPLLCAEAKAGQFTGAAFGIDGALILEIERFAPTCPLAVGPFEARVTGSALRLGKGERGQAGSLEGSATIELPDYGRVDGTFGLDLTTGTFTALLFELDQPFTWEVPEDDPFLRFRINRAVLDQNGFVVDGRHAAIVGAESIGVTFDELTIDLERGNVVSGAVVFDEAFGVEAGINEATGELAFRAVPSGSGPQLDPGLMAELSGTVTIDAGGLRGVGEADAFLSLGGKTYGEDLSVVFTPDFALGIHPQVGVRTGRMDFEWRDTRIAWVDHNGFHADLEYVGDQVIPDRLPLPLYSIAYVQLRENDELLVDVQDQGDGTLLISNRPDQTLDLVAPVLNPADPPVLGGVQLTGVTISASASNPEVLEGSVSVNVNANDPAADLSASGIPFSLQGVSYETRTIQDAEVTALFIDGQLYVFGELLTGGGQATAAVQSDGVVYSSIEMSGIGEEVRLVQGSDRVVLSIDAVSGGFSVAGGQPATLDFDFQVDGQLRINDADQTLAWADIGVRFTDDDLFVTTFSPNVDAQPLAADLGLFGLRVHEITSLPLFELSHNQAKGGSGDYVQAPRAPPAQRLAEYPDFTFAAILDATIDVRLANGDTFSFPFEGVEVGNLGLRIPAQDVNLSSASTDGHFGVQDLGGFSLEALALRTDAEILFEWYAGPDVDLSLAPTLDLALDLPEFGETGALPIDGLSITDASFDNGILLGTVTPHMPQNPVPVPLRRPNAEPAVLVERIAGSLEEIVRDGQRAQGIDVLVEGILSEIPGLEEPGDCPVPASFSLRIVEGRGFEGQVTDFTPCGELALGPVGLQFGSSTLELSFANDTQSAELSGTATVRFPATSQTDPAPTANGLLTVDILEGRLTDGFVEISEPFAIELPIESTTPILRFVVNQGRLDSQGLTLSAAGTLESEGASANVQFQDLLLAFPDFQVASGEATISPALDLLVGLRPFGVRFIDPNTQPGIADYIATDFDATLTLNQTGLGFTGSAVSDLVLQDQSYAALRTEFEGSFALNVGPFAVNQGRALFYLDENNVPATEPLAILDQDGLTLGGGILAILPDRIGLPTEDVAYVDIKDDQGQLLITIEENTAGGWSLSTTQALDVIVPVVRDGAGQPLTIATEFDLQTDSYYNVQSGGFTVSTAVDLEPHLGVPVEITSLSVSNAGGPVAFAADLRVVLPESFGSQEVTGSVRFSEAGFETATLAVGTFTRSFDPALTTLSPVSSFEFTDAIDNAPATLEIALLGAEVEFAGQRRLEASGTIGSSLLGGQDDHQLFFVAGYSNGSWTADLESTDPTKAIQVGQVEILPAEMDALSAEISSDRFVVSIDGSVSFEQLLGEDLEVDVMDLQIGVENVTTSPGIVFGIAGGSVTLPDQALSLFDGKVKLALEGPSLTITGRTLAVAAGQGSIEILDKKITVTDFRLDSEGTFSLGGVDAGATEFVGSYVTLTTLSLSKGTDGLRLEAGLNASLPDPIGEAASAILAIYRDQAGVVQVETDGPAFDLDKTYPLGEFATFRLTKVKVDLDVLDPQSSGVYANGVVEIGDRAAIWFGNDANFPSSAGISYSRLQFPQLQYNATGNVYFELQESFFEIAVEADAVASSTDRFLLELGGSASVLISGVGGTIGYEGLTVSSSGVEDVGKITTPASVTLMEIATLDLGEFERISSEQGVDIEVPAGMGAKPEDLAGRAGQPRPTQTVSVTEYLCFGACTSTSSASALQLSLGGKSSTGGFSGGVDEIVFYRRTDGGTYLHVDNFHLELAEVLSLSAGLQYEDSNEGSLLRVVAAGTFDVGGTTAQAALAGSFANVNGELSFGLFVAVAANVGIPIVPGIVELTGAGGGFFYNPRQDDLNIVTGPGGALEKFGYTPVGNIPRADGVSFALMLYAQAGIGGTANQYVVRGQAFLQLTDQSVYLDASGFVKEMDGSGVANAEVSGAFYIQAQRNPFFLDGGIKVTVNVPIYLNGTVDVNVFMGDLNGQLVWGVIGHGEFGLIADLFTARGDFVVCADGFLLTAGLEVGFSVPVISITGSIEGSIWIIDLPGFQMPFGAYAIFEAELCVTLACATATAKAALVTKRPSGYELFAAVSVSVAGATASAWVSVDENRVRGGLGSGGQNDLIARAQQQAEDFKQHVNDLKDQITEAQDELLNPELGPEDIEIPDEVIAAAGTRFHLTYERFSINSQIEAIEPVSTLPTGLGWVRDNLLYDFPGKGDNDHQRYLSARTRTNQAISKAAQVADNVVPRLNRAQMEAVQYEAEAEASFHDFLQSLTISPVGSVDAGDADPGAPRSPSFDVDDNLAASQSSTGEQATGGLGEIDQQVSDAVDVIERNLTTIDSLMALQVTGDITYTYDPFTGDADVSGLDVSIEPSVNDMMLWYTEAETRIREQYALEANKYWKARDWATSKKQGLLARESSIESGIQTIYSGQSGEQPRAETLADRIRIIYQLAETGDPDAEADSRRQSFLLMSPADQLTAYLDNGMDLWFDMHGLGLDSLARSMRIAAMGVAEKERVGLQPMVNAHAAMTARMEEVYALRADMAATLFGIVDNYLALQSPSASDSLVAAMTARRTSLTAALQVPSITSVVVSPVRYDFRNVATTAWSAQHPVRLSEVSYQLERSDATDIGASVSDFRSLGHVPSLAIHNFKRGYSRTGGDESFYETQEYSLGLRARGAAGNTAIRRATFQVAVGPAGTSTSPSTEVLTPDTTPPAAPRLLLGDIYNSTEEIDAQPFQTADGHTAFTFVQVTRYWTKDPLSIRLLVRSTDDESDIAEVEYAVGTTRGGTDLIDWTPLQGERRRDGSYVQIDGATRVLNMVPGDLYFVSVRSTNGAGLTSPVTDAPAVVYDDTSPTAPGPVYTALPVTIPFYTGITPPVFAPVTSPPEWDDPYLPEISTYFDDAPVPEVTASWTASTDDESGVLHYEYATRTGSSDVEFGDRPGTATSTQVEIRASGNEPYSYSPDRLVVSFYGQVKSYVDTTYMAVRARNNAGSESPAYRLKLLPRDPTPPYAPEPRASVAPGEIRVYLAKAVYDFESDLEGFQYSIGTSAGATDVRPWPAGRNVDFAWTNSSSAGMPFVLLSDGEAPSFAIPVTGKSGPPEGVPLYVNVRAINGQGRMSPTVATGPVTADSSPPPAPTVSLLLNSDGSMTISAGNMKDPESGLKSIEYKINDEVTSWKSTAWQTFKYVWSLPKTTPDYSKTVDISTFSGPYNLEVGIRVTNGVGQQTRTWAKLPLQIKPTYPVAGF